jgi:hypothetical protein
MELPGLVEWGNTPPPRRTVSFDYKGDVVMVEVEDAGSV